MQVITRFAEHFAARGRRCVQASSVTLPMVAAAAFLLSAAPAAAAEQAVDERVHQASSTAERAVEYAKGKVGKPYRWGAEGPNSFDCSGLVQWSYQKAGVSIPRTTYTQYDAGTRVSRSELKPGDLVFFYSGPSHVGMYIGNGKMVHASSSGSDVRITGMSGYYDSRFAGAVRVA